MGEMLYYVRKIFYSKGGIDHSQSSFISVIKYTHGQIFYYLRKISFQKPTLYRPHSTELICTTKMKLFLYCIYFSSFGKEWGLFRINLGVCHDISIFTLQRYITSDYFFRIITTV